MSSVVQTATGGSLRIWPAQNVSICATVCLHNAVPYGQVWSTHSLREVCGRWLTHTRLKKQIFFLTHKHTYILYMCEDTSTWKKTCTCMQYDCRPVHTLSAWLGKQKLSLCFGWATNTEVSEVHKVTEQLYRCCWWRMCEFWQLNSFLLSLSLKNTFILCLSYLALYCVCVCVAVCTVCLWLSLSVVLSLCLCFSFFTVFLSPINLFPSVCLVWISHALLRGAVTGDQ